MYFGQSHNDTSAGAFAGHVFGNQYFQKIYIIACPVSWAEGGAKEAEILNELTLRTNEILSYRLAIV